MNLVFFLVVNSRGTVRTTKQQPDLKYDEIAIKQCLAIPNAIFDKPTISATVVIPESAAVATPITAEVQEDPRLAIEQATGMLVRLTVEQAEESSL